MPIASPGRHTIDILYDGLPIPGSPFVVNVRRGCDPKKCRAFGPGLDRGLVEKANMFTVETKGMLSLVMLIRLTTFHVELYVFKDAKAVTLQVIGGYATESYT
jgi:hypothetical protein